MRLHLPLSRSAEQALAGRHQRPRADRCVRRAGDWASGIHIAVRRVSEAQPAWWLRGVPDPDRIFRAVVDCHCTDATRTLDEELGARVILAL